MDKIVVLRAGRVVSEHPLDKQVTIIGRNPEADILLDDTFVSRSHAQVVMGDVPYIEDLDSGNGIFHQGRRVRRVTLKNGQMVNIGNFLLRFDSALQQKVNQDSGGDFRTQGAQKTQVFNSMGAEQISAPPAVIKYLSGPDAGNILDLRSPYTALGALGSQVAVVTRRPDGYYVRPVSKGCSVVLNGKPIEVASLLTDHANITVGDLELEFHLIQAPHQKAN